MSNLPNKPASDYAPFQSTQRTPRVRLECPFNQPQGPRDEHGALTQEPEPADHWSATLGNGGTDAVLHGGPSRLE